MSETLTLTRTWEGEGWMPSPDSSSWLHATFFAIAVWFFCITFQTFYIRSASAKSLWPFVAEQWPRSQCHVTAHLMQMLTVVDLFGCFSTSIINLAIHDDSKAYSNESRTTTERWPPYRSYDISYMTSSQVIKTFTSITLHRIKIDLWARCHFLNFLYLHQNHVTLNSTIKWCGMTPRPIQTMTEWRQQRPVSQS